MESRISLLMEKYWRGETSLKEEQEIREYYQTNPSLAAEGSYFRQLQERRELKMDAQAFKPRSMSGTWTMVAATIVGIIAAVLVFQDAKKQREYVVDDPKEAYEITRNALLMVSSGLNEGQVYTSQIHKINKAEEIIKN